MPWRETNVLNERQRFARRIDAGWSVAEACKLFGISRKTGHKIVRRYRAHGIESLGDRSRAPRSHPNQTSAEVEGEVLRVRRSHPTWGSKKILAVLERTEGEARWPARSTVDEILKRAGLVEDRRSRRRRFPSAG